MCRPPPALNAPRGAREACRPGAARAARAWTTDQGVIGRGRRAIGGRIAEGAREGGLSQTQTLETDASTVSFCANQGKNSRDHARWIEGPRTHQALRRAPPRRTASSPASRLATEASGSNGARAFERAPSSWIKMKSPATAPREIAPPAVGNRIVAKRSVAAHREGRVASVERDRSKRLPTAGADELPNRALDSTRPIGFRGATRCRADETDEGPRSNPPIEHGATFDPLVSFRPRSDRGSQAENEATRETSGGDVACHDSSSSSLEPFPNALRHLSATTPVPRRRHSRRASMGGGGLKITPTLPRTSPDRSRTRPRSRRRRRSRARARARRRAVASLIKVAFGTDDA